MARKKSLLDIMNQHNRIDKLIVSKYGSAKRGTTMYSEGIRRSKTVRGIAGRYKANVVSSLGGKSKVTGNMKLITKRVSRSTYMGTKARGAVSG